MGGGGGGDFVCMLIYEQARARNAKLLKGIV